MPLSSPMRASAVNEEMRPVNSEYRASAFCNCVAEAPGKFVPENIPIEGSEFANARFAVGISVWFFAQIVYCVALAPMVKLCAPLSHVTTSSPRIAVALRDEGVSVPLGFVSCWPTFGNDRNTPFEFATLPVVIEGVNSGKKSTGAPL